MNRIEMTILKNLIYNDSYVKVVLPFLKKEYFSNNMEKNVFSKISEFILNYENVPTYESLVIELNNSSSLREEELKGSLEILSEIRREKDEKVDKDWLINQTEKFCQERAIHNALLESIQIIDEKTKTSKDKGSIPEILSDALSVSFDSHIGHDYTEDYVNRYDFYHMKEEKIPFDLEFFNKITKGGVSTKTLNIILAGTGAGKSLFMCHHAAACLNQGKNVLYITLEMAEEKIAERIDANLLNVNIDDLYKLSKKEYERKIEGLRVKTNGKLIIKEYPTASASVLHFKSLLNELHLKRRFKPDIIFVDYLNICCSSRLKFGANVNTYSYVKSIAEELRGLAVEHKVPIFSATQTTRTGFTNTDPGLEDTSESFGLPATSDFMFALVATEELDKLNQIQVKQLKNRYSDPNRNKRFMVGIDRAKMKLYDVESSAQADIIDSGQGDMVDYSSKFKKNYGTLKV
jgi:replicative DNA helicase